MRSGKCVRLGSVKEIEKNFKNLKQAGGLTCFVNPRGSSKDT